MQDTSTSGIDRQAWLSCLATAPHDRLVALAEGIAPRFDWLRRPETGAVMVRGRTGATGAPFNLGEMTVTRCSLRLDTGEVGHGYVRGRSGAAAEAAARVDAILQTGDSEEVRARVIDPLRQEAEARRAARSEKAAATRVDFFTMVRGED